MAHGVLEVFYAFASDDRRLHKKLDKHLASLVRQGLITTWSAQDIDVGTLWEQELR
jgi:hypothetical protein